MDNDLAASPTEYLMTDPEVTSARIRLIADLLDAGEAAFDALARERGERSPLARGGSSVQNTLRELADTEIVVIPAADAARNLEEIDALRTALRELYELVVTDLDRDPAPVEDYLVSPDAIDAAKRAGCVPPSGR